MIEFLNSSRVAANHREFKELGYKSCLQKIAPFSEKTNEFTHPFRMATAYTTDVMPYSNYTYDFKGLIDYIFYSKNTMVPLGLLGPVDAEWFRENKVLGCPHRDIPSGSFHLFILSFILDSFSFGFCSEFGPIVLLYRLMSKPLICFYDTDHFSLLVELEMSPTYSGLGSNGFIPRR